jgi:hypothetical protein
MATNNLTIVTWNVLLSFSWAKSMTVSSQSLLVEEVDALEECHMYGAITKRMIMMRHNELSPS